MILNFTEEQIKAIEVDAPEWAKCWAVDRDGQALYYPTSVDTLGKCGSQHYNDHETIGAEPIVVENWGELKFEIKRNDTMNKIGGIVGKLVNEYAEKNKLCKCGAKKENFMNKKCSACVLSELSGVEEGMLNIPPVFCDVCKDVLPRIVKTNEPIGFFIPLHTCKTNHTELKPVNEQCLFKPVSTAYHERGFFAEATLLGYDTHSEFPYKTVIAKISKCSGFGMAEYCQFKIAKRIPGYVYGDES